MGSERRQRLFEVGIGSKIGTGDRGRILLQLTLELTAVIDFVKDPARFARDLLDPGTQANNSCILLSSVFKLPVCGLLCLLR